MVDDCVFCKIAAGKIPAEKVLENDDFIVIKDANQQVEGHSLVISKEHYEAFSDIPSSLYEKFLRTTKEATLKLGVESYNLVTNNGKDSGRLVAHVHLHILPRVKGDGFKLGI